MSLAPLKPHEIVETFRLATRLPTQAQLDALVARDISPWALAGAPGSGEWGVAFGTIERTGDARFDFAEVSGEAAMLVLALNEFAEVVDIVAATKSGFVGSWDGRCAVLGLRNAMAPRIDAAVTVHETLPAWLKDDRRGLLIVDPARARVALEGCDPFRAEGGVEHGLRLQAILAAPLPRVVVPAATLRKAA